MQMLGGVSCFDRILLFDLEDIRLNHEKVLSL